jgi:hypothetical protein
VYERILPWKFHDHFGVIAGILSFNGANSKTKVVGNFLKPFKASNYAY